MMDERREAQASLYAIGALPPGELREFEAALRADSRLAALVAELRGAADAMVAGFPQSVPPPALKSTILGSITNRAATHRAAGPAPLSQVAAFDSARTPGWMLWLPYLLAVCFAVLCVVLISLGRNLREQAVALSEQLAERANEAEELRSRLEQLQLQTEQSGSNYEQRLASLRGDAAGHVAEIQRQAATFTNQLAREQSELKRRLGASENDTVRLKREKKVIEDALSALYVANSDRLNNSRVAILRPAATGSPQMLGAAVWLPNDQRGLLVLEGLAVLPPSQSYQLWLVDPNASGAVSVAVFSSEPAGTARQIFSTPANLRASERFAVSVEPKGGGPRPTGKFVLTSE